MKGTYFLAMRRSTASYRAELRVAQARGLRAAHFHRMHPNVGVVLCSGYHGPVARALDLRRDPVFCLTAFGVRPFTWFACDACVLTYVAHGTLTGDLAKQREMGERQIRLDL